MFDAAALGDDDVLKHGQISYWTIAIGTHVPRLLIAPVLFVGISSCDEPEDQKKAPEPREVFTYEHRFTAEWKGEVQEGIGTLRCKVYSSNAPGWTVDLGSGGAGRDRYSCEGQQAALAQFSDGTQLVCAYYSLQPRTFATIARAIRENHTGKLVANIDSLDKNGNAQRIWFDAKTGKLPPNPEGSVSGTVGWEGWGFSVSFRCFTSRNEIDEITIQKFTMPGYTSEPNGAVILEVKTVQVPNSRPATKFPEKFLTGNINRVVSDAIHEERKRSNGFE